MWTKYEVFGFSCFFVNKSYEFAREEFFLTSPGFFVTERQARTQKPGKIDGWKVQLVPKSLCSLCMSIVTRFLNDTLHTMF